MKDEPHSGDRSRGSDPRDPGTRLAPTAWRDGWTDSHRRLEEEVEEELRFHLEELVQLRVSAGESPSEALRAVLEEEGFARAREHCVAQGRKRLRRRHWREGMEGLWRDLTLAARKLRRNPGFASAAILTLALGVGANTAVFSVLDGVLYRPLPYPDPGGIVQVWPGKSMNTALTREIGERVPGLVGVAGYSRWQITLLEGGESSTLDGELVHPDFLSTLGATPHLGRIFLREEYQEGNDAVVVLSHDLWQSRFGGDPEIVGRTVEMDGYDHERRRVVGVMSPRFLPPGGKAEAWAPLRWSTSLAVGDDPSWHIQGVIARLAPGTVLEQASSALRAAADDLHAEYPVAVPEVDLTGAGVVPLRDALAGGLRWTLWVLLGTVGLVLLIASANLATLLLARGESQAREVAVRAALGARRGRLLQQSLAESAVLGLSGGTVGLLVGHIGVTVLGSDLSGALPAVAAVEMNLRVLAFALGTTGMAVILATAGPALRAMGEDPQGRLRTGSAGSGRSRRGHRLNRILVASQLALATMVVLAAALVGKSFRALLLTDPGFRGEGVVTAEVALPMNRYPGEVQRERVDAVVRRLQALPGVEAAGGIHLLPLTPANWSFPILPDGHVPRPNEPLPSANYRVVAGDYFGTLGIPLMAGAFPSMAGVGPPERVMVVNQAFANLYLPGGDPIGREVRLFGNQPFRLVAVVGDVRQHALSIRAVPEMYVYYGSSSPGRIQLVARSRLDPEVTAAAIRAVVREVDPTLPVASVRTFDQVRGASVTRERLVARLLAAFGVLALGLGALGVYGVTSYAMRARTREMGIQLAIGAAPSTVLRGSLRRELLPVAAGLAVGAGGALAAGRALSGLLYQVEPNDPAVLAVTLVVLGTAATLAAWLPARRVTRGLDPMSVLRAD